jgi:hypothetical protein
MHALVKDLIELLDKYDLRNKIIAYVKDEGFDLNIMTIALKFIISCDFLIWQKVYRVAVSAMHFLRLISIL